MNEIVKTAGIFLINKENKLLVAHPTNHPINHPLAKDQWVL